MLTNKQIVLLMGCAEFHREIEIAAIRVAAKVRDEEIAGEMTLARHQKRFTLVLSFLRDSYGTSKRHAASTAVALAEYLTWPNGMNEDESGAKVLATNIPSENMVLVLEANLDLIAGWDAVAESHVEVVE